MVTRRCRYPKGHHNISLGIPKRNGIRREPENNMTTISILLKVAKELIKDAASLFADGSGVPIHTPDDVELETGGTGVIDELHPDTEVWRWMNSVLFFLRMVHGILDNAVERNDISGAAEILDQMKDDTGDL